MTPQPLNPATIEQTSPQELRLSGFRTAFGLGVIQKQLDAVPAPATAPATTPAAATTSALSGRGRRLS